MNSAYIKLQKMCEQIVKCLFISGLIYKINSIIFVLYRRNKSTDHKTEFYGAKSDVSVAK